MITLHFNVIDNKSNIVKHGQAIPLSDSDDYYQFNFLSSGRVTYTCCMSLEAFVRFQAEVGFLVTFSVKEYFFD